MCFCCCFFFFKQKTAYEMRISDWSSDVCSSDLWRPDLCARRLQFWAAHAPLILSSTDLIYRSRVLNTLARGARHIDRVADKQPVGVRRIATWAGILTAGLLIPGGDARRAEIGRAHV